VCLVDVDARPPNSPQVRVGALQQAACETRIGAPRRVVTLPSSGHVSETSSSSAHSLRCCVSWTSVSAQKYLSGCLDMATVPKTCGEH
jgi:hypothetical protein